MECQAVKERQDITRALARVFCATEDRAEQMIEELGDEFGTEKGMMAIFSIMHGVVREYLDGGDQMTENCTCGQHVDLFAGRSLNGDS